MWNLTIKTIRLFSVISLFVLPVGCAIVSSKTGEQSSLVLFEPNDVKYAFKIMASSGQNPDADGEPSPLVVRIYQLADLNAFNRSEFFSLYDKDELLLGAALKHKKELNTLPGETIVNEMVINPQSRFIAVLAGFQDIDNAKPKLSYPIDAKDPEPMCLFIREKSMSISADC